MEIVIQPTVERAIELAQRFIVSIVRKKPSAVLGLATGRTPVPLYEQLIKSGVDFGEVRTFNLDEYIGVSAQHSGSFSYFMNENFFKHVRIKPSNIHIPNGMASNIQMECAQYEERIKACGGIDVQVLGIGRDGHIGFNEPSSSLRSRTRMKTLTEKTRQDNAIFFKDTEEVPKHCITMGVGTIMDARSVVLLAFGSQKAEIIKEALEGPITAMVPASVLQMHENAKVFLDEAAAAELSKRDYYKWVFDNKPEWQKF